MAKTSSKPASGSNGSPLGFEATLWATAHKLLGNLDTPEYKHVVLGLFQMVQAARSGVQNIAEGSQASGASKKMELKLTSVARASLEELRLDYEDFLRQRGLAQWAREDPRRAELIARRPGSADAVA
jgi:four helix bundle protein